MPERVHLVAVDVRHRAGRAKPQVAADEHDANRVARLERSLERHLARAKSARAAGRSE